MPGRPADAAKGTKAAKAAKAAGGTKAAGVWKVGDERRHGPDPRAQELARRRFGLVGEFTDGDPGIFHSLRRMYENEDTVRGMDIAAMRPGMEWIGKAAEAAGIELPKR